MNKKVVPVIAVILVLLIGGYLFMRKAPALAPATQQATQPTSAPSLRDLISKGIAQTCTFSTDNTQGTMYISGGKVRGNFNSTLEGKTVVSHIIIDTNTSYLWMDGTSRGIKMSFDPNAKTSATPGTAGSFDAGANMNYKCSAWIVDSSMFTLPAGVTFTTFSAPTAPAGNTSGSSQPSQCSYCDSLSGDPKTQCLSALNCK